MTETTDQACERRALSDHILCPVGRLCCAIAITIQVKTPYCDDRIKFIFESLQKSSPFFY